MSTGAAATDQSEIDVTENQNSSQFNGIRKPTFFDLPLELRQEVYRHIPIAFDEPIQMDDGLRRPRLPILQVCRRLRSEAFEYFFSNNAFVLWSASYKTLKQLLGQESKIYFRKLAFLQ